MPLYVCRVADDRGKIQELLREAVSEEPLLRELSSRSLYVLSLRELKRGEAGPRAGGKFPRRVIAELTDLLALMMDSGLSLKDSLEVVQTGAARGAGRDLAGLLLERISTGVTFAGALDLAGDSVPSVYRGMVRIGERVGSLDRVFSRLADWLGNEKKLRERFGAALLYPIIVLGVAFLSALLIIVVLFPRLREVFATLGPSAAGRVDSLMGSLAASFLVLAALVVLGSALVEAALLARRKDGPLAARIDGLALKVPIVSSFLIQKELLNFTFAMETLTAAGVSVEEALSEGAGAVANKALGREILEIRRRVIKGEHISAAFAGSPLFPARISRWVAVGERIGHVEKVFAQLRAYYQQEVEKWINRLVALMEPALIVVLGIFIVLFVVFFIIPIFSLYGTLL